jgi:hypothetical protein
VIDRQPTADSEQRESEQLPADSQDGTEVSGELDGSEERSENVGEEGTSKEVNEESKQRAQNAANVPTGQPKQEGG